MLPGKTRRTVFDCAALTNQQGRIHAGLQPIQVWRIHRELSMAYSTGYATRRMECSHTCLPTHIVPWLSMRHTLAGQASCMFKILAMTMEPSFTTLPFLNIQLPHSACFRPPQPEGCTDCCAGESLLCIFFLCTSAPGLWEPVASAASPVLRLLGLLG